MLYTSVISPGGSSGYTEGTKEAKKKALLFRDAFHQGSHVSHRGKQWAASKAPKGGVAERERESSRFGHR